MGLFDRLRGASAAETIPLSAQEAFLGVAWCAVYADDVIDAEEDEGLAEALADEPVFRDASPRELREMHEKVAGLASRHGEGALLRACAAALPPELRAEAFLVCARLVAVDGEVDVDEEHFIHRIRDALQVDPAEAERIFDRARAG